MTWEQFASLARDWMKRLPPTEARAALAALLAATVSNYREVDLDAVIALALKAEPVPAPEPKAGLPAAPPPPCESKKPKRLAGEKFGTGQELRGRPSKRAQALVREQLADGPKPGEQVQAAAEAAEISERTLIAAADALGVRARKGQWWLPTAPAYDCLHSGGGR